MVISVFNTAPGFQAYQQSRRARLQDQALRTEQEAMARRQAAFNTMLGQIQDPQRRAEFEMAGPQGALALIAQRDEQKAAQRAAQRAAQAESAAAAQERADAFMSEVYRPALEQAAPQFFEAQTPEERLAIAGPLSRRLNIESQRVGGRGKLTPEALIAELEGYVGAGRGRNYNFRYDEYVDPSTGAIVQERIDPRTDQSALRYLDGTPYEGDARALRHRSGGQEINVNLEGSDDQGTLAPDFLIQAVADEAEIVYSQARRAPGELRRIESARRALESDGLRTGAFGGIRSELGNIALSLGADESWVTENIQDVDAAQGFESIQNISALALRNPDSGFGLTGNTSNRDVQFLLAAVPNLTNTRQANELLLDIMEQRVRVGQGAAEVIDAHIERNGGRYNPIELRRELNEYYSSDEVMNAAAAFRDRAMENLRAQVAPSILDQLSEDERNDEQLLLRLTGS